MTRSNDQKTAGAFVRRTVLGLGAVSLAMGIAACGDEGDGEPTDEPCLIDFDCPTGQVCDTVTGTCGPDTSGGDTDVVDDTDVPDNGGDTDAGEPDVSEDPTNDPGSDPTSDPDAGVDTDVIDNEVGEDTDVIDNEVGDDTDTDADLPDTEVGTDTDTSVEPGDNPWIAFVTATSPPTLNVIRADGTGLATLDVPDTTIRSPEWSPDGQRLAYIGYRPGDTQFNIRILNFGDGSLTSLEPELQQIASLSWSPAGNEFVVEGNPAAGRAALWRIDSRSGATTQFTTPTNTDAGPTWAWGSDEIYFVRNLGTMFDVFKIPAAGGTPTQVTFNSGIFGGPTVTPDGSVLYYQSGSPVFLRRVAAGGAATQIGQAQDAEPDVLPNGTQLVISRLYADAGIELAIVNATTGAEIRRLTFDDAGQSAADASPVDASEVDVSAFVR